MSAEPSYRFLLLGSSRDHALVSEALAGGGAEFELTFSKVSETEALRPEDLAQKPDVVLIGPTFPRPFPVGRQVRALSPGSQILFLVPPERLTSFQASLPFVPDLASAWIASTDTKAERLAGSLAEAARVARQRSATATVLGRINDRLTNKPVPAEVRRSQLALSERYLATILTQSPDALVAVGTNGTIIAHNDAAMIFFGALLNPEQARLVDLFPADERSKLQDLLARAASGEIISNFEVAVEFGGKRTGYAELSLAPVRDEAGVVVSVSMTARDISDRKRAEDHQRLLINELNHRVKNTLAIVQSLAQQSFKGNAAPADEMASFAARLGALAAAHNLLTLETWQPVSLAQVIRTSLAACGVANERSHIEGPEVTLRPQTAVSVALAMHELCTNAIKYGSLSNESGQVAVQWRTYESAAAARLRLEWAERGGPLVVPPSRKGFGSRMIERGLAAELDASVKLEYAPQGVLCVIEALLPDPGT